MTLDSGLLFWATLYMYMHCAYVRSLLQLTSQFLQSGKNTRLMHQAAALASVLTTRVVHALIVTHQ